MFELIGERGKRIGLVWDGGAEHGYLAFNRKHMRLGKTENPAFLSDNGTPVVKGANECQYFVRLSLEVAKSLVERWVSSAYFCSRRGRYLGHRGPEDTQSAEEPELQEEHQQPLLSQGILDSCTLSFLETENEMRQEQQRS